MSKNQVVYTAVFGEYDFVQPVNPDWNCDFICFTDRPENISNGWTIKKINLNGEAPALMNRRYKMLPHLYLSEYEYSMYVDGNIQILQDPNSLFIKYLTVGNIAIPIHQDRNCAYDEAIICIKSGRVDKQTTEKQFLRYAEEGFPKKFGMTENGIILRRHNEKMIRYLMEAWWEEYYAGGRRDQLSLPYLIWRKKIKLLTIKEGPRIDQSFFKIKLHSQVATKSIYSRFAVSINQKKHINISYKFASLVIEKIVKIRDSILIR